VLPGDSSTTQGKCIFHHSPVHPSVFAADIYKHTAVNQANNYLTPSYIQTNVINPLTPTVAIWVQL